MSLMVALRPGLMPLSFATGPGSLGRAAIAGGFFPGACHGWGLYGSGRRPWQVCPLTISAMQPVSWARRRHRRLPMPVKIASADCPAPIEWTPVAAPVETNSPARSGRPRRALQRSAKASAASGPPLTAAALPRPTTDAVDAGFAIQGFEAARLPVRHFRAEQQAGVVAEVAGDHGRSVVIDVHAADCWRSRCRCTSVCTKRRAVSAVHSVDIRRRVLGQLEHEFGLDRRESSREHRRVDGCAAVGALDARG